MRHRARTQRLHCLATGITHHFRLEPLRRDDVGVYLMFRLRAAGYHGPNPFTARAVEMIAKASEGLSRRINILADKALLAAYSSGSHQVDAAEVKIAAQDARFAPIQQKAAGALTPAVKWSLAGVMLVALAALAYSLWPRQPAAALATANPPPATAEAAVPDTPAQPAVRAVAPPVADGSSLIGQHEALYASWLAGAAERRDQARARRGWRRSQMGRMSRQYREIRPASATKGRSGRLPDRC